MSNPYRPKYTDDQDRRVRDSRKRLLARWVGTSFSETQPRSFRVAHSGEEIDNEGRLIDVFLASNASPAFSETWSVEIRKHRFEVEHGTRSFTVRVPHAYYLDARLLPCSVDWRCAATSSMYLVVALLLLLTASDIGLD